MLTYHEMYHEYISRQFEDMIVCEKNKYVIYPNGYIANIVKEVLMEKYGIEPEYIVDNYVYDGKNVLNLEQARTRSDMYTYYLVCSDKDDIYDEIREKLRQYVDDKNIVELFPREVSNQYIDNVNNILDIIDGIYEG